MLTSFFKETHPDSSMPKPKKGSYIASSLGWPDAYLLLFVKSGFQPWCLKRNVLPVCIVKMMKDAHRIHVASSQSQLSSASSWCSRCWPWIVVALVLEFQLMVPNWMPASKNLSRAYRKSFNLFSFIYVSDTRNLSKATTSSKYGAFFLAAAGSPCKPRRLGFDAALLANLRRTACKTILVPKIYKRFVIEIRDYRRLSKMAYSDCLSSIPWNFSRLDSRKCFMDPSSWDRRCRLERRRRVESPWSSFALEWLSYNINDQREDSLCWPLSRHYTYLSTSIPIGPSRLEECEVMVGFGLLAAPSFSSKMAFFGL